MIDKDTLLQMAELCKLNVVDEDLNGYVNDLSKMLDSLERIKEINTDGVEITYNVNNMKNPLREDKKWESIPREDVLRNTREEQYGFFKILKVMD